MKEATLSDMELGNILFGHSRGVYAVEPRMSYQDAFVRFLRAIGCDADGYSDDGQPTENDTFVVRPYYWGEDEAIAELPNFVYKPTRLEIRWYKYPMRDAYSNLDVSIEEFKSILAECEQSMRRDNLIK